MIPKKMNIKPRSGGVAKNRRELDGTRSFESASVNLKEKTQQPVDADLPELNKQRRKIDAIDEQILALLNRRLRVAKKIGQIKRRQATDVWDAGREKEVFARLLQLNAAGRLPAGALVQIFSAVIHACRKIQRSAPAGPPEASRPRVYAVLGNPVAHSMGPTMHNAAFSALGYNGVYLALTVTDIAAAVTGLKTLGFSGASITLPYKTAVMEHLDEIDDTARRIGAVNTIVSQNGRLVGTNTDGAGAVEALSEKTAIGGRQVTIIGAGGAARAIGFAIISAGGRVTIANRSTGRGRRLAAALKADFVPLEDLKRLDGGILINTTPVGMAPHSRQAPVSSGLLTKKLVVMDIVYHPRTTRLLQMAADIGCVTVDGVAMFIHQGARQFELWTGRKAPVDIMRRVVVEALETP